MRKVKITDALRKSIAQFNSDLFDDTRTKEFEHPKHKLEKLFYRIKPIKHSHYRKYIRKIIDEYDNILNADPQKMKNLISDFNKILSINRMSDNIPNVKFKFHEEIVFALRYEDLRDKEYPEYLLRSNVKTCVYCNSQSTLVIEKKYYDNKKRRVKDIQAKLHLDHFYPKSKYPFLATSFFNLYPTCANCNSAKSNNDALFELYTLKDDLDVFNFWIDDKSILDYWMKFDLSKLKVNLETKNGDFKLLHNHNKLFQIQSIYDNQIDVAEELILKAKANPQSYRKILNKEFSKLFPDISIIDRLIIGNYSKPEEIHKRPLAKYSQDIARQLKIIK